MDNHTPDSRYVQLPLFPEKRCPQCGNTTPLTAEYWFKNRTRHDGFSSYCKICHSKDTTERSKRNPPKRDPEKRKASANRYARKNREKIAAYYRALKEKDPERVRAYGRKWEEKNPEKHRVSSKIWRQR